MKRPLKTVFTLAIPLSLMGLAGFWVLGAGRPSGQTIGYDTAAITKGTIKKVVATSGPVRALVTVSIGSQLSGQIDQVPVDFNSEVKEGDVLANLDAKTFSAKVDQAKADLAVANANLINQDATLVRNKAMLVQAKRNSERQTSLQSKGFASSATLDLATRDAAVAEADIAVAEAQIVSAKATIEQKKAAVDQAQIDLDRSVIRAPISGTVISRTVDPGQTVAASLQAPELFKLAQDLARIRIEAQVNEADVGEVAQGNPVTFTVDAYPDREFTGKVTQVRLSATELNNVVTYTVIIEAANEDRRLFPGMTANVQVEAAKRDQAIRVPNDALRFKPRGTDEATQRRPGTGDRTNRGGRQIDRLKEELQLTAGQEKALRDALAQIFAARGDGSDQFDPSSVRQMVQTKIEQVLSPTLTDVQRPLFDKWKRGREAGRSGTVYVVGPQGVPERQFVRIGISDDQFTEILGDRVKLGDLVVLRARAPKK